MIPIWFRLGESVLRDYVSLWILRVGNQAREHDIVLDKGLCLPVSTISNASADPDRMILISRFNLLLNSSACLMLVEPAGATIVLPLRSLYRADLRFDLRDETARRQKNAYWCTRPAVAARRCWWCCRIPGRSWPLANSGMRVEPVTS